MSDYDAFLSYKRGAARDEGMKDLFMPWFNKNLDEAFADHERFQLLNAESGFKNGEFYFAWARTIFSVDSHCRLEYSKSITQSYEMIP